MSYRCSFRCAYPRTSMLIDSKNLNVESNMNACFSMTFELLNVNDRVKLVPCFAGSPKSPDANLSFIEVESRLREKIRVNAAELHQVSNLHRYYHNIQC